MNKIYVATKLRSESSDCSYVSVLAVGSYDDCKKAVRAEWEKYAEHDDIGEFDEEEQNEWYCTIDDKICYTLTFEIHCVDVNKGFGV